MSEKKSFLLYISSFKQIRKLTLEQKGNLLDAIMNFQEDIPLPEMDPLVDMCFGFIAEDMQRDAEKYEEIVEKRRESGRKGGKTTQANQANARFAQANQANATSENQANQANQAVNVNVNVNDKDNVKEDVNEVVNVKERTSGAKTDNSHSSDSTDYLSNRAADKADGKPTNPEIAAAIIAGGYSMTGENVMAFIRYNDEHGWKMPLADALRRWNELQREPSPVSAKKPPGKKNFLNNGMQRTGAEKQANDELKAKLIAMQGG